MKNIYSFFLFTILFNVFGTFAQQAPVTRLDEVRLSDSRLYKNSRSQVVTVLKDSVLRENDPLLTNVLKFNSLIFFRENGYGMVSSASFRGTTASQTAVVWNGININSQFTGQTDFNTINTTGYEDVAVRAGGGSVLYGSGAIGGSVHLNNKFRFSKNFSNTFRLDYGSFNTRLIRYSGEASSEKTSVYINAAGTASNNDFPYPVTGSFNENGDFQNMNVSAGIAHWLDENNILKFYSESYTGERGFSGTLTAPSRSKFEDVNHKNLLEWKGFYGDYTSSLKVAYLEENYKYFENRSREDHSFGNAKNYIANYDLSYRITEAISLNGIVDHRHTKGRGSSVGENTRNITAFAFLFNHDLGRFFYELSTRKEITNNYESPILYSLGAGYAVTSYYGINLNLSRNFRIPTYNDLYWSPGGNIDLDPESSYQAELGHTLKFGTFEFGLVGYIMEITNLLRWIPNRSGLWQPVNTGEVRNYGLEARSAYQTTIGNHQFSLNAIYAYTKTEDKALGRELIYVPNHKVTGSLAYTFKDFSFSYQFLHNGSIYTSSDNVYELKGYSLSNAGIAYSPPDWIL
ncbi:TonB-dependent receptor [Antarcticibacterium flavum]|uniref:TonB-dependent receptor n=1 Tax=Antarcticibacterium flavum TaxID=2058175 RepID=A0A5B7X6Y6_9FLAO|nr:TonB-dependent receptor [Antarcticibacterium flavum]QCY71256.1 TonB-dependent receptor [Antarcticibacterium flavum]